MQSEKFVYCLINYLNNPKCAIPGTTITRFDEMAILEENELKRGIAEKIRDTLGEAELRKLKDDWEYIEERTPIARFFGMFTGQNKLDDFMIDQIEIRRDSIKRKLSTKMSLAYNYSIHDLVAKIRMFTRENDDDDFFGEEEEFEEYDVDENNINSTNQSTFDCILCVLFLDKLQNNRNSNNSSIFALIYISLSKQTILSNSVSPNILNLSKVLFHLV